MAQADVIICEHCDAVYRSADAAHRTRLVCSRCHCPLSTHPPLQLDTVLALTLTAVMLFVIANVFPIIKLELGSEHTEASLFGAIVATWESGVPLVALLAAATTLVFPLALMLLTLYVMWPLRHGRRPRGFVAAMHALRWTRPWSMIEVFMLSVLVAVVKLGDSATVIIGPGLWAVAGLTILLTLLSTLDLHALWSQGDAVAEP